MKPAADIHLGVGLAAEMTGRSAVGGGQIPFDDRKLLVSAFDHKPMNRVIADDPANLALEFLQTRHGFSVWAPLIVLPEVRRPAPLNPRDDRERGHLRRH